MHNCQSYCANMQYNIISIPKSLYSLCYFCLPPYSNLTSLWMCVVSFQQRTPGIYLLFLYRGHCSKSPLVMKWSIPHRTNSLIHSWIKVHLWLWPDDHVLGSACGPKGKKDFGSMCQQQQHSVLESELGVPLMPGRLPKTIFVQCFSDKDTD